jgi:hypothetical protein
MLSRVVLYKVTDVSEVLATSIIRGDGPDDGGSKHHCKLLPDYTAQHPQKTDIFILASVRTLNLTSHYDCYCHCCNGGEAMFL